MQMQHSELVRLRFTLVYVISYCKIVVGTRCVSVVANFSYSHKSELCIWMQLLKQNMYRLKQQIKTLCSIWLTCLIDFHIASTNISRVIHFDDFCLVLPFVHLLPHRIQLHPISIQYPDFRDSNDMSDASFLLSLDTSLHLHAHK